MKVIPLLSSTGAEDSLYDEVVPRSSDKYANLIRVQTTGDKRLSAASGYYELAEVKHEVPTVYRN